MEFNFPSKPIRKSNTNSIIKEDPEIVYIINTFCSLSLSKSLCIHSVEWK